MATKPPAPGSRLNVRLRAPQGQSQQANCRGRLDCKVWCSRSGGRDTGQTDPWQRRRR
ncbi:unnamed protein product [Protopolystoma xenopodis]|uniref:Uncharacterized protein n=1 Tax=Protopolystoma xenopodis TaxID=117903 RepID=A0A3S5CJ67_9PLAT|nr:unnamed protein product [Protopolystoma xenopodis]